MDKHWELIDAVYRKGWESKGQTDYDPRGTAEWQDAVDAFDDLKQRLAEAEAKIPRWIPVSEQEDGLQKDELTTAYLTGCYDTRKAYEQQLAEAEELKADFKKAMKLFEDTGLDNLLWTLLDTITKGGSEHEI